AVAAVGGVDEVGAGIDPDALRPALELGVAAALRAEAGDEAAVRVQLDHAVAAVGPDVAVAERQRARVGEAVAGGRGLLAAAELAGPRRTLSLGTAVPEVIAGVAGVVDLAAVLKRVDREQVVVGRVDADSVDLVVAAVGRELRRIREVGRRPQRA